jgi:hypothetical protein
MPSEMKRLRQLEEENGRLKRIVADLSLDKEMLRRYPPKAVRPARMRRLVDELDQPGRSRSAAPAGRCRIARSATKCLHRFISRSALPASLPSDDAESSGQARSKVGGTLK